VNSQCADQLFRLLIIVKQNGGRKVLERAKDAMLSYLSEVGVIPYDDNIGATRRRLTWHAPVVGVEVGGEVFGARLGADQRRVGDAEVAGAMPGAGVVERREHVDRAPDVAVVACDAPAELHPTKPRPLHHHHLAHGALGVEHFRQTVLLRI